MGQEKQINGLLSIARKGNFAIIGLDNIKKQTRSCNLIIVCDSASEKLKKEAIYFSNKLQSKLFEINNLAELIQISNCKIVAIKNIGIANSIIKILEVKKFDN